MSYMRRALLSLNSIMLCGCVSYPNYPSSWPSLESARQDCLSINGVYHNRGDWSRSGGSRSYLAPRLLRDINRSDLDMFSKDKALTEGVDRVEIAVTKEGKLEITARDLSLVVKSKELFASKDEYKCNDGKIEIADFIVGITGARQESVILSKSIDGALVVKDGAAGLMLFVLPVAGNDWHRFEPFKWADPEWNDNVVNCVAGGELRWTDRSKCD